MKKNIYIYTHTHIHTHTHMGVCLIKSLCYTAKTDRILNQLYTSIKLKNDNGW